MHFAVKTAHTKGAVLNDPLSSDILARARVSNQATQIVDQLVSIEKIFGQDLPLNQGFRAELLAGFCQLARNPAVASATQIVL
jgi:mannitol-1-phosphate/altronate dehydrogenase